MDNGKDSMASVPYFIHEGIVTHMARNNLRLLIALIVSVLVLFLNNVAWLMFYNAHETRSAIEVTVDENGR